MIRKLILRNFKGITEQTYDFTTFDLLVGRNNSGKSTILQALAIWQFCVDEFGRKSEGGNESRQIILPNFTALPVPRFNLLWHDTTVMKSVEKKPSYIIIDIGVVWRGRDGGEYEFAIHLRYHSPQTIYAYPANKDWKVFKALMAADIFPKIAYVPPFSGLEPGEEWRDDGVLKRQVGKAQPGSILRNLLQRVYKYEDSKDKDINKDWKELHGHIKRWFDLDLQIPKYQEGVDTEILCAYRPSKRERARREFDIIAGGSGFHQTLILLSFLYWYHPTTILLDEPDAHLHVNLQREILGYFKEKSNERSIQFLIATHSEEMIRAVGAPQIVSLHAKVPKRIQDVASVISAMANISNVEIAHVVEDPFVIYVEGDDDERILRAWAGLLPVKDVMERVLFSKMGGGPKDDMNKNADRHYQALKQFNPGLKRLVLFDYDDDRGWHPEPTNPTVFEWTRRNIENYLLIPDTWIRAVYKQSGARKGPSGESDIFCQSAERIVRDFFEGENLSLPKGAKWQSLGADIFNVVNGKALLFDRANALYHRLKGEYPQIVLNRDAIAGAMVPDEIHDDVRRFFDRLSAMVEV